LGENHFILFVILDYPLVLLSGVTVQLGCEAKPKYLRGTSKQYINIIGSGCLLLSMPHSY